MRTMDFINEVWTSQVKSCEFIPLIAGCLKTFLHKLKLLHHFTVEEFVFYSFSVTLGGALILKTLSPRKSVSVKSIVRIPCRAALISV